MKDFPINLSKHSTIFPIFVREKKVFILRKCHWFLVSPQVFSKKYVIACWEARFNLKHVTKLSSLHWSIWHSFCLFSYKSNLFRPYIAFFYDVIVVQEKFQSRKKVNFQGVGAITFLALFHKNHIHWQQHTMSRSCDLCSHNKRDKCIIKLWL